MTPLPAKVVLVTHSPSGYEIRGFTQEQLIAYGKAEYARAVKDSAEICRELAKNGIEKWYVPRLNCAEFIEQDLGDTP